MLCNVQLILKVWGGTFTTNATAQHGGPDLVYVWSLQDLSMYWSPSPSISILNWSFAAAILPHCQFVMILASYIFLTLDLPGCCWSRSDETISIHWHGAILCVPTEANSSHWFVSMADALGGRLSKEWKNKTVASLWKLAWSNISIRPGADLATFNDVIKLLNSSSWWNLWRCRWIWPALPRLDPCRSTAPAGRAENLGLPRNDKYIRSFIIMIHLSCTKHFQTVMLKSCKKMSRICQPQALSRQCTCASRWWTGKCCGSWAELLAVSQMCGPNVGKAETSAAAKSSERG